MFTTCFVKFATHDHCIMLLIHQDEISSADILSKDEFLQKCLDFTRL